MQMHTLTTSLGARKKRVGRGGKRGKTAGRGTKGQNARAGHRKRPEERDLIKKIPKLRGHGVNRVRTVASDRPRPVAVSLAALAAKFAENETVTPRALVSRKVVARRKGRIPRIKIVAGGALQKKLTVRHCSATAGARAAIEKAGGTVVEA